MLFKPVHMDLIKIGPKEQIEQDFGESGAILIPGARSKTYLHWLTDKGNIRSTFTMTYATRVQSKVRIINALDEDLVIQVLTDW